MPEKKCYISGIEKERVQGYGDEGNIMPHHLMEQTEDKMVFEPQDKKGYSLEVQVVCTVAICVGLFLFFESGLILVISMAVMGFLFWLQHATRPVGEGKFLIADRNAKTLRFGNDRLSGELWNTSLIHHLVIIRELVHDSDDKPEPEHYYILRVRFRDDSYRDLSQSDDLIHLRKVVAEPLCNFLNVRMHNSPWE